MKKIYNSRIFWMLVSLLISIFLWTYITEQDTSTVTKVISGVEVQFSGEDELRNNGLAIANVDSQYVDVTVRGTRSIIRKLNSTNVSAVIDVGNITQAGDMSWSYYLRYSGVDSSSISVVNRSPETISFTVSKLASKTVDVRGEFLGSVAEGYTAEDFVVEPSTLEITGSEETLEQISYAWFSINTSNISEDYVENADYVLMDADGNEISKSGLTFSADYIKVTLPVVETKEIPLSVKIIPGGGATEEDCSITIVPSTIKISGESAELESMDTLQIAEIDLNDITDTYDEIFTINLSDTLTNVDQVEQAEVIIQIEGMETSQFAVTDIEFTNVPEGYQAVYSAESLRVTVRGPSKEIKSITGKDIHVTADLSAYDGTSTTIDVPVTISIDNVEKSGALGNYTIEITLQRENNN